MGLIRNWLAALMAMLPKPQTFLPLPERARRVRKPGKQHPAGHKLTSKAAKGKLTIR